MITARPLAARRIVAQRIRGLLLGDTGAGAAFDPLSLFSDGEVGTFNDIQTYSTSYFTDTAGTDPAELEDAIALVLDQSGNGINWSEATAGNRPLLTTDGGFPVLNFASAKSLSCTLAADTYTIVLATRDGIWIDSVAHAGGAFAIGPTTYTVGPVGLLSITGTKLIGPPLLLNRQLTSPEQSALIQFLQNRGAGALYDSSALSWNSATDTYGGIYA